jgi:hypothetical protein
MKPTKIVAILLALMAIFPLLRIVLGWEITLNGSPVPMWISAAFFVLFLGLAVILCREERRNRAG